MQEHAYKSLIKLLYAGEMLSVSDNLFQGPCKIYLHIYFTKQLSLLTYFISFAGQVEEGKYKSDRRGGLRNWGFSWNQVYWHRELVVKNE